MSMVRNCHGACFVNTNMNKFKGKNKPRIEKKNLCNAGYFRLIEKTHNMNLMYFRLSKLLYAAMELQRQTKRLKNDKIINKKWGQYSQTKGTLRIREENK